VPAIPKASWMGSGNVPGSLERLLIGGGALHSFLAYL
jgi:hypothetical protein